MRKSVSIWLLIIMNLFLTSVCIFLFFKIYRFSNNFSQAFCFLRYCEAKLVLNKDSITPFQLPNIEGDLVKLNISSHKFYAFLLLSLSDCETCILKAINLEKELIKIPSVEVIFIFNKTDKTELINFLQNRKVRASKLSKILIDYKGSITHLNFNFKEPSLILTEGLKIRYFARLKSLYQDREIVNEIKTITKCLSK